MKMYKYQGYSKEKLTIVEGDLITQSYPIFLNLKPPLILDNEGAWEVEVDSLKIIPNKECSQQLKSHINMLNNSAFGSGLNNKQLYCLNDKCKECYGTGRKEDNSVCIHYISCPCHKCSPTY